MQSVQEATHLLFWTVIINRNFLHIHDRVNEQRSVNGLVSCCAIGVIDYLSLLVQKQSKILQVDLELISILNTNTQYCQFWGLILGHLEK